MILPLLLTAITAFSPASSAQSARPLSIAVAQNCVLTVVLQCEVGADGAAKACKVASEDPNSLGAGQAALAMSAAFQLTAREDGQPVYVPVRINTGQCAAQH